MLTGIVDSLDNLVPDKARGCAKLYFVKREGITLKDKLGFCKAYAATCLYSYPMKLMLPMHASCSNCQWVYPVNYGGGLVAGDSVDLDITIVEDCCVMLTSQSSTKVNICQSLKTIVDSINSGVKACIKLCTWYVDTIVVSYKDPVCLCSGERSFEVARSPKNFYITSESSLILMDWFTAGRIARGESWDYTLSHTTNSIYVDDVLYFRDSIRSTNSPHLSLRDNMNDYNIVASCVIVGQYLESLITDIHKELSECRSYDSRLSMNL
ncbi:hypothetical protein BSL78_12114 [Apostichopus japonicus]|uniref:Urease accessory protein UreD n=1 Tax=Stichopus japonicus TaxID=307972 RepID=A0A2G8KSP9_STIJA|nr:hypothetical protein BSL78_12114 [Apostichopus japonicus]